MTFAQPKAAGADDFDPTAAAKLKTLSFTIRGLAEIKTQLNREYTVGNTQFNLNTNQFFPERIAGDDSLIPAPSMTGWCREGEPD